MNSSYPTPQPTQPPATPASPEYVIGAPTPEPPKKKHRVRNWTIGLAALVTVGAIIGGTATGGSDDNGSASGGAQPAAVQPSPKPTTDPAPAPAPKPTSPAPAPVTDDPYGTYSAAMSALDYPVLDRATVDKDADTFCDSGLDAATIHDQLLSALMSPGVDPVQLGAELGAVVQSYCPERVQVFHDALSIN